MTGRPDKPIDECGGPVARFAEELRRLRRHSGLTYRQMSSRAGYSYSALSRAASGRALPSWKVVDAFVRSCGDDPREWWTRWRAVALERDQRTSGTPRTSAVDEHRMLKKDALGATTDRDGVAAAHQICQMMHKESLKLALIYSVDHREILTRTERALAQEWRMTGPQQDAVRRRFALVTLARQAATIEHSAEPIIEGNHANDVRILREISRLTQPQKEIMALVALKLRHDEIAKALGLTLGEVREALSCATAMLKSALPALAAGKD